MIKGKNQLKKIDAPIYSFWSALYMSFYSRRLFVDVGKRWRGFGFLYLLLVVVLFYTPYALRLSLSLNESFSEQFKEPLNRIPVFYIQNGKVLFDKPMPYFIKNDKNQVVTIIDTTGKINDFNKDYPYLTILINKDKLSFKPPTFELFGIKNPMPEHSTPLVQTFDNQTNLVFDGKKISEEKKIIRLKYISQVILYPITIVTIYSVLITLFLLLGFLGQVFSRVFFDFSPKLIQSVRILVVSGTPMLLVLSFLVTLNVIFTGYGLILMILLVFYYSLAIRALRLESKQTVIY